MLLFKFFFHWWRGLVFWFSYLTADQKFLGLFFIIFLDFLSNFLNRFFYWAYFSTRIWRCTIFCINLFILQPNFGLLRFLWLWFTYFFMLNFFLMGFTVNFLITIKTAHGLPVKNYSFFHGTSDVKVSLAGNFVTF